MTIDEVLYIWLNTPGSDVIKSLKDRYYKGEKAQKKVNNEIHKGNNNAD